MANCIFAVLGVIFFGENDPANFGDLPRAMMPVWYCEMLDDWGQLLYIIMFGCDRYGYFDLWGHPTAAVACDTALARGHGYVVFAYFFVVVVHGGIVMQTVLIGIVPIAFDEATEKVKHETAVNLVVRKVLASAAPCVVRGGQARGALRGAAQLVRRARLERGGRARHDGARPVPALLIGALPRAPRRPARHRQVHVCPRAQPGRRRSTLACCARPSAAGPVVN